MKNTFLKWAYEFTEWIIVATIGSCIYGLICWLLKGFSDNDFISRNIVFILSYYFGYLLKPYINEIRDYIFNNDGDNDEE